MEKKNIIEWMNTLESASKGSHYAALYKRIYRRLKTPSRIRGAVSIYKLNIYTKEGDNVIVPKKVLSTGKLDHKINISALEYSSKALKELKSSGCSIMDIKEMVNRQKINLIV